MADRRPRGRPRHPDVLTPAEWDVLHALRHGLSRRDIARRRRTSVGAVRYHVGNIGGKLGVTGGMRALRHGSVPRAPAGGEEAVSMAMSASRVTGLGQVSLVVRDVQRAEAFYRDVLGLAHLYTFGDLAFFDVGGTRLYLHRTGDAEWRPGSILYLTVDDIAAAHDALVTRDVPFSGAPHRIHVHEDGTEEWMAFFTDPDGNMLALMSRVPPGGSLPERRA